MMAIHEFKIEDDEDRKNFMQCKIISLDFFCLQNRAGFAKGISQSQKKIKYYRRS